MEYLYPEFSVIFLRVFVFISSWFDGEIIFDIKYYLICRFFQIFLQGIKDQYS